MLQLKRWILFPFLIGSFSVKNLNRENLVMQEKLSLNEEFDTKVQMLVAYEFFCVEVRYVFYYENWL